MFIMCKTFLNYTLREICVNNGIYEYVTHLLLSKKPEKLVYLSKVLSCSISFPGISGTWTPAPLTTLKQSWTLGWRMFLTNQPYQEGRDQLQQTHWLTKLHMQLSNFTPLTVEYQGWRQRWKARRSFMLLNLLI